LCFGASMSFSYAWSFSMSLWGGRLPLALFPTSGCRRFGRRGCGQKVLAPLGPAIPPFQYRSIPVFLGFHLSHSRLSSCVQSHLPTSSPGRVPLFLCPPPSHFVFFFFFLTASFLLFFRGDSVRNSRVLLRRRECCLLVASLPGQPFSSSIAFSGFPFQIPLHLCDFESRFFFRLFRLGCLRCGQPPSSAEKIFLTSSILSVSFSSLFLFFLFVVLHFFFFSHFFWPRLLRPLCCGSDTTTTLPGLPSLDAVPFSFRLALPVLCIFHGFFFLLLLFLSFCRNMRGIPDPRPFLQVRSFSALQGPL